MFGLLESKDLQVPKHSRARANVLLHIVLLAKHTLANLQYISAHQRVFSDAVQALINHGGRDLRHVHAGRRTEHAIRAPLHGSHETAAVRTVHASRLSDRDLDIRSVLLCKLQNRVLDTALPSARQKSLRWGNGEQKNRTHAHVAVLGQERERLALVPLDQNGGRVDEAEGLVSDDGHVGEAVDGEIGADPLNVCKVHLLGFGRRDG